jgi:PIN domain nuclease of toxin-antitoxin system
MGIFSRRVRNGSLMNDLPSIILLDTHIWLWLASGAEKAISPKLRGLIDHLRSESGVRVSAISLWEIGMLASKNRIVLSPGVKEWVYNALGSTGAVVENVNAEMALESTLLPEGMHNDPADRILLATAVAIKATLVTRDKEILSYSKKHGLPALSI